MSNVIEQTEFQSTVFTTGSEGLLNRLFFTVAVVVGFD